MNDISKTFLLEEYLNNKKSTIEIGEELGVSSTTIKNYLKKFNIPVRSNSRLGRTNKIYRNIVDQGKTFGNLFIVKAGKVCECQCKCGNICFLTARELKRGRVKSCGCLKKEKVAGFEGITGNCFNRCRYGAISRKIVFDITAQDMWDKFVEQDGKCAISGVPIFLRTKSLDLPTASLDRIDSQKGYVVDNIHWVHKTINIMKWDLPLHEFVEWCKIVAKGNS